MRAKRTGPSSEKLPPEESPEDLGSLPEPLEASPEPRTPPSQGKQAQDADPALCDAFLLGFEEWFVDWWQQRSAAPWQFRVFLDEPIRKAGRVVVYLSPDAERRDTLGCRKEPPYRDGYERPRCILSETLTPEWAFSLRRILSTLQRTQSLPSREGIAFLFHLLFIAIDYRMALTGRDDSMLGWEYWLNRGSDQVVPHRMPDPIPTAMISPEALLLIWGMCRKAVLEAGVQSQEDPRSQLSFLRIPSVDPATGRPSVGPSRGALQGAIRELARSVRAREFWPIVCKPENIGDLRGLTMGADEMVGADAKVRSANSRTSATSMNKYCRIVTRRGTRILNRAGYEKLPKNEDTYAMFIDGLTLKATCQVPGKKRRVEKLTPKELGILSDYVLERKAMRPYSTPTGHTCLDEDAARKLFTNARRKVDIETKRFHYRCFRLQKGTSPQLNKYVFDPPADISYCLILPI